MSRPPFGRKRTRHVDPPRRGQVFPLCRRATGWRQQKVDQQGAVSVTGNKDCNRSQTPISTKPCATVMAATSRTAWVRAGPSGMCSSRTCRNVASVISLKVRSWFAFDLAATAARYIATATRRACFGSNLIVVGGGTAQVGEWNDVGTGIQHGGVAIRIRRGDAGSVVHIV